MDINELKLMQNYPLWMKVEKTKQRIREFYDHYQGDVYISFSGGKDSTVLLDIARQVYPDIPAVFVDTGLEYPEIKEFVKTKDNVVILRPAMSFKQVLEKYGYPFPSKEQAQYISEARNTNSDKLRDTRLNGNKSGRGKVSKKWVHLIDAPFNVSHKCCDVMKKNPSKKYEKETGRKPILGIMASESALRTQKYLAEGCNSFNSNRPNSSPMGFWTEQDVLEYIVVNDIEIASVYGDVVEYQKDLFSTEFETTGCDRTGCVFCLFGIAQETGENRIQRLARTHPELHTYCMEKLGIKEVLDYNNIRSV